MIAPGESPLYFFDVDLDLPKYCPTSKILLRKGVGPKTGIGGCRWGEEWESI